MKTPAGSECPYFYGDYYRGKSVEECRLIGKNPPPQNWTRDLCATCPVPAISRANACPNMILTPTIKTGLFGIKRRVVIQAYCTKSETVVKVPEVGCSICHTLDPFIENDNK